MKPLNYVRRSWWLELTLVDFRHVLWPWVVYIICIVIFALKESVAVFLLGFVLLSPAVMTALFSSDFAHHTISALLAFERSRLSILTVRLSLAVLLTYVPPLLVLPLIDYTSAFVVLIIISCHLGVAPFLANSLKRPLLVWSAIVVSPMLFMTIWSLITTIFQFNLGADHFKNYPNISISYTLATLSGAFLCLLYAYRQWLRLEVR